MKLNSVVENQPVVSNVGQVGEFRIRNSAKAFNILSSGLYANKIRAIIRELSCNAVDSHVAAGKADTPFDVHLPNQLEPWFSIRDYGTGLTNEQVTNIYTTYFESTKTDSNAFIGALGLGSKSPFSYTDNFTVTAIKDGKKGVYTAFINEQGVPSIALMVETATVEPNGVEVKFSVNERYDFEKFSSEAREVYRFFKNRPVISGNSNFKFSDLKFKEMNIVPGVHTMQTDGYNRHSIAIMGNIAYPIQVPNAESNLGNLHALLNCGLVMEFDIGELDFQASREGLSYVSQTIDAIKKKLVALNGQLAIHIAKEADKITNLWERSDYLQVRMNEALWSNAVIKYVADTKFPLINLNASHYDRVVKFKLTEKVLAEDYNITIRAFTKSDYQDTCSAFNMRSDYDHATSQYVHSWHISPTQDVHFVINDTNVGCFERAKYHWRENSSDFINAHKVGHSRSNVSTVYILEKKDKTKEMKIDAFFAMLYNPPANKIHKASGLDKKERQGGIGRNVSILKLQLRERGRWSRDYVWTDAGSFSSFVDTKTYYYVEMRQWETVGTPVDIKELRRLLEISGVFSGQIYGVRRADIEVIKQKKNWVELNSYVRDVLTKMDNTVVMGMVKKAIDFSSLYRYNCIDKVANKNSPYVKLYTIFKDVKEIDERKISELQNLCSRYQIVNKNNLNPDTLIKQYRDEVSNLYKRYPLLEFVEGYSGKEVAAVAEYVNIIDQTKGV